MEQFKGGRIYLASEVLFHDRSVLRCWACGEAVTHGIVKPLDWQQGN